MDAPYIHHPTDDRPLNLAIAVLHASAICGRQTGVHHGLSLVRAEGNAVKTFRLVCAVRTYTTGATCHHREPGFLLMPL